MTSHTHQGNDHIDDHDHNAPGHDHTHGASEKRVGIAAVLTGLFMLAEVFGGIVSGSLALIADAGHMVTDFASLALAWYGFRLARRPADWKRTYGYDRFSILVAFANGLALFAVAGWILFEAWHRLEAPTEILGGLMLWIAVAGLVVNLIAFWILRGGNKDNLNMRAARLHVAGDLLGSVAAIIAAVTIMATGWTPIDPILSVVVALIILRSAWHVVRDSGHILLEGAPTNIDTRDIPNELISAFKHVHEVHHVHAWSIAQERPMMTLHARVTTTIPPEQTVAQIKNYLKEKYGIVHSTVEVEFETCADHNDERAATC